MKNIEIKFVIMSLVLLVAMSIVDAQGFWKNPSSNPVSGNEPYPITQSDSSQTKSGLFRATGISNVDGSVLIASNGGLYVGDSASNMDIPANFFGPVYLQEMYNSSKTTDYELCVDRQGFVKRCGLVSFYPDFETVYTSLNVTTFPSAGVKFKVNYIIPQGVSCTPSGTRTSNVTSSQSAIPSTFNWASGTLTGTTIGYEVTARNWGKYDLTLTCDNNTTKKVTVYVKGQIDGTPNNRFYQFNSNQVLDIVGQAAGASGVATSPTSSGCVNGTDAFGAFVHVSNSSVWNRATTPPNVISLDGGKGAKNIALTNNATRGCGPVGQGYGMYGVGGKVLVNNLVDSTARDGEGGKINSSNGGCPGATGSSCTNTTISGHGGLGWTTGLGGGGGAYAQGKYSITNGQFLYIFAPGVTGPSNQYQGNTGFARVEWY